MKPYMSWISPEERMACQRQGIILKLASLRADSSRAVDMFSKQAETAGLLPGIADLGLRGVVLGSLIGGIPLGVLAHALHKSVKRKSDKERDLEERISFMKDVTRELETGMRDRGVRV